MYAAEFAATCPVLDRASVLPMFALSRILGLEEAKKCFSLCADVDYRFLVVLSAGIFQHALYTTRSPYRISACFGGYFFLRGRQI